MIQSWGISRFNGQINRLHASINRAGVTLVAARIARESREAAPAARGRGAAAQDWHYLVEMRVALWATGVSALAFLMIILL